MKKIIACLALAVVVLPGCKKSSESESAADTVESITLSDAASEKSEGNSEEPAENQIQAQAGTITAGEWNDLDNWSYWQKTIEREDFSAMPEYWSFHNNNRIDVSITINGTRPAVDVPVVLKRNGKAVFKARTDNKGNAVLWAGLEQAVKNTDFSKFTIDVNKGGAIISDVKPFSKGVNKVAIQSSPVHEKIEIAFVVDATGSMGDELEYLKTELLDVIEKVKDKNPDADIATASVFYRDKGDEYLTRVSGFSDDIDDTLDFIKEQSADGGGDFPEAVHTALDKAVGELQWSDKAKTRLLFLLLDAPPHHDQDVITDLQKSVTRAAAKGIKIIPVMASGIDKETEFLMRFMAMTTNGTYVFITDDSGVGNSHLEPTVGEYQVEYLNSLMVRLINKYAE